MGLPVEAAAAAVSAALRAVNVLVCHAPSGYRYLRFRLRTGICDAFNESQVAACSRGATAAAMHRVHVLKRERLCTAGRRRL